MERGVESVRGAVARLALFLAGASIRGRGHGSVGEMIGEAVSAVAPPAFAWSCFSQTRTWNTSPRMSALELGADLGQPLLRRDRTQAFLHRVVDEADHHLVERLVAEGDVLGGIGVGPVRLRVVVVGDALDARALGQLERLGELVDASAS